MFWGRQKNLFVFLYTGHMYIENITDGISVALNVMGQVRVQKKNLRSLLREVIIKKGGETLS